MAVARTPVGRCVTRTADSVRLTCWPPGPLARIVSHRTSFKVEAGLLNGLQNIAPNEPVLPFAAGAKWTTRGPLHGSAPGVHKNVQLRVT